MFLPGEERTLLVTFGGTIPQPVEAHLVLTITPPAGDAPVVLRQSVEILPGGGTLTFSYTPPVSGLYPWRLDGTGPAIAGFSRGANLRIDDKGVTGPPVEPGPGLAVVLVAAAALAAAAAASQKR